MIQALHTAVQGRARFKVQELYRSERLKQYLERSLSKLPIIHSISANSLTSSVLVLFQPDIPYEKISVLIQQAVSDYQNQPQQNQPQATQAADQLAHSRPVHQSLANAEEQMARDWHLMEADAVVETLQTSRTSGLSEVAAAANLDKYGPNVLTETETRSDLSILIDQFKSLPVALLSGAAVLSIFTGGLADAAVIMGVVAVNAAIGYVTESQSERIIQSLKSHDSSSAFVIRDGKPAALSAEEVVPGDILLLKPGHSIAADARLLQADNLSIDESALTGESIPVTKTAELLTGEEIPLADRSNMVYRGTFVTGGQGLAAVTATGKFTEMGQIQRLVDEATATDTPLSKQLDEVGSQLVLIGSAVCGVVFGIGLFRGFGFLEMLKSSISLAVAAVPEGLPTIATTTLALGIQDMRQRNVLVRGLSAVEALGSVQTICMDKTGTITENRMSVVELHLGIGQIQVIEGEFFLNEKPIHLDECDALLKLIHISVLCNESEIAQQSGGYAVNGSSTENALIDLAIHANLDVIALREQFPRVATNQRSENRNIMSTIHITHDKERLVAVKGSPAEVLARCNRRRLNGEVVPLSDQDRQAIEIDNERMAGKALRVLGAAYTYLDSDDEADPEQAEQGLIWLGLIGMADPIRKGVTELIAQFHQAGIDTVMITGDQSPTAYAIAKELKLSRDQDMEILDSTDLTNIDAEALTALCDKVDVFARVSPVNKLQIVQALQGAGKVVAMTGDGINDTPALKSATVGVAMGHGGTEVAREVADIILEDDRLETMIIAVSQGRTIYNNIRKSVHFLLATNLSEIMVTLVAIALGLGEPLNALQLLWLNLVSDIFPGLALAMEPPEPEVLSQPPRDPNEPIIKPSNYARIAFESATISASTLGAYGYSIARYGIGPQASTVAFMSLTSAQLLQALSCRSPKHRIFEMGEDKLAPNPYLFAALGGSFALQFLTAVIPGLRTLLRIAPLDILDVMVIAGSTVMPLLVNEITKDTTRGESDEEGLHVHV